MKRQLAIFMIVSLTIAVAGLVYGAKVITDLTILYPIIIDNTPGTKVVLQPKHTASSQEKYRLDVLDTQRVINQRLHKMQLPDNYKVTITNNQLEVTLPASQETPHIINVITKIGKIAFVDGGDTVPPIGQFIEGEPAYQTLFTGQDITTVDPPKSDAGDIFYQIELQPAAAKRFADFVKNNQKGYACLTIDQQIINCSNMYYLSGNTLDILPSLSSETDLKLSDLAVFLSSGPLPVSLEMITN